VVDEGLAGATDVNVLAEGTGHSRLVGTLDSGFTDVGCTRPSSTPGPSCSGSIRVRRPS
jgi:predicted nuclease of predicted toxin-antitoxin system